VPEGARRTVNINHYYHPREIGELLDYVKPRGVIYHRSLGAKFADVLPPDGTDLLVSIDDGRADPELPGAVTLEARWRKGIPTRRSRPRRTT